MTALAPGADIPVAQATTADRSKLIVRTACADNLATGETLRTRFVCCAVDHGGQGQPEAVPDIAGIGAIQPELDKCREVNLTRFAYESVIKASEASATRQPFQ